MQDWSVYTLEMQKALRDLQETLNDRQWDAAIELAMAIAVSARMVVNCARDQKGE